jgi:site-specific DNA-cytosine methylase
MRVLELFSGTHSVGKICQEKGWEVISLDLKGADINQNILEWDYTIYPVGHFDLIWASPPCDTFSNLRQSWIGRKLKAHNGEVFTMKLLLKDIEEIGLPILRKTEEIIDYFQPRHYFIENPQTSRMKDYMTRPFYDVDYCMYSDFGYQKRTRIWTNLEKFEPKLCNKQCGNMIMNKHKVNFGGKKSILENGKLVKVLTQEQREKYKDLRDMQLPLGSINERYRIPFKLIRSLFDNLHLVYSAVD